jgi:hypothetical protein
VTPMDPAPDDDDDLATRAARWTEGAVWLLVVASAVAHLRRVVATRSVFGGDDTLAAMFVAVVLLAAVRAARSRRR